MQPADPSTGRADAPAGERTPAAHWREKGERDPFDDRYACERAKLAMGNLTDDELANAVFMYGGDQIDLAAIQRGEPSPISLLTAAKDRIRWLSRALEVTLARLAGAGAVRDAWASLGHCVDVDPDGAGGGPVLKGTRFTVAQMFAELADSSGPADVARTFGLDVRLIRALLMGLAYRVPTWTALDEGAVAEGVPEPGIYIASKAVHGPRWRELRDSGHPIISTWIDEAETGRTADWADLWDRCANEPARAAVTVLYREHGEELKGALAEVGAALSHGRKVIVVGPVEHTWTKHQNVEVAATLPIALIRARFHIEHAAAPTPRAAPEGGAAD